MAAKFPLVVVDGGAIAAVHYLPAAFTHDGIQHPATAWDCYAAADWSRYCPTWQILPLVDVPPSAPGKRVERQPEAEWIIGADAVAVSYRVVDLTADEATAQLLAVAAEAAERINREAGEQRARHITVTTGQEGTYTAKQAEVERYAAGGVAPFPYLEAEAAATGATVADIAGLVLATAKAWTALNARIEGARRGALVAVDRAVAAGDAAAVAAVFPIAWPSS